jgi:hypothetical protein
MGTRHFISCQALNIMRSFGFFGGQCWIGANVKTTVTPVIHLEGGEGNISACTRNLFSNIVEFKQGSLFLYRRNPWSAVEKTVFSSSNPKHTKILSVSASVVQKKKIYIYIYIYIYIVVCFGVSNLI